jgi:hypothetical protein
MRIALALSAALAATVPALTPAAPPGPRGGRMYDAATVATVAGEVTEVVRVERRRHAGVHLVLKTEAGPLAVHLGPDWFVERSLKLAQGDRVEATGSRVEIGGKPVLLARTLKRGADTLELRDEAGIPRWAGQGRGRGRP